MVLKQVIGGVVLLFIIILFINFLATPNKPEFLKNGFGKIVEFVKSPPITGSAVADVQEEPIRFLSLRGLDNNPSKYLGDMVEIRFVMGGEFYLDGIYHIYDSSGNSFKVKKNNFEFSEGEEYLALGVVKKETRLYLYNKVTVYYVSVSKVF
ncbi:hypothetical protein GOV14_06080 [Candidatus Pacearchaeota archaeon]|nr:hypothetical protein [Candidatus Pacearchaeota archaeon]